MTKLLKWVGVVCSALALAACGGGGGSSGSSAFGSGAGSGSGSGGTGITPGAPTVALVLSSTTVTVAAPVTVTATVLDASGAPVAGMVVAFTTPGNLGTLSPATALTDASGNAAVQLAPASATTSGADQVVASVTVGTVAVTGTKGFTVLPGTGPIGTPSLALTLSTANVTTTTPATVTASIKDANGGAVVGQVVSFTSSGALGRFSPASALTDGGGNAVVTLSPTAATTTGADKVVATTTVNGTTLTASQGFQVTITNADLLLTLSSAQIPNTGSATVGITVTAIDSKRNTVAGVPVAMSADSGAVLTNVGTVTGSTGSVTASLGIGSNRANRLITVTATSGAITRTATVQVVGTTITSKLLPAITAPTASGAVQYRVTDQAGNPMVGQAVQIVATGLVPAGAAGTTGPNGDFNFIYASPALIGSYPVVASIAGATDTQTVVVQSAGSVAVATGPITSASVSSNPSVVSTNLSGSSINRSEIRALFLGANNLPIPNVRATFNLNGDVNSIGGTFTTGTSTLYSDVNGVVTTAYVPGTRSSPTDGVSVKVCYGLSDTDPNLVNCTTSALTTLTVTAEPLGVSIGTNELIIVNELTYVKKFVVSVVDAAGVAKPDVNIVASVDLTRYRKGHYKLLQRVVDGKPVSFWSKTLDDLAPGGDAIICANEDTNRNGVLEAGENLNGAIEYVDASGNPYVPPVFNTRLDPGKSDVSIFLLQTKTRADGTAELQLQYAKSFGSWVDAKITVAASGVSGTEGRASYLVAPVPVDAASINDALIPPAYVISPYGQTASCANPN